MGVGLQCEIDPTGLSTLGILFNVVKYIRCEPTSRNIHKGEQDCETDI